MPQGNERSVYSAIVNSVNTSTGKGLVTIPGVGGGQTLSVDPQGLDKDDSDSYIMPIAGQHVLVAADHKFTNIYWVTKYSAGSSGSFLSINGGVLNGDLEVLGEVSATGTISSNSPATAPAHLTRKDYVDAADAAVSTAAATDATTKANAALTAATTYTDTELSGFSDAIYDYADQAEQDAKTYADAQDASHSTADRAYSDSQDDSHSTADRAYTDTTVGTEATARITGDAATLSSAQSYTDAAEDDANTYTDDLVSAEAILRAAADTTLQGNIDAEETSRIAADAATLASAQAYADTQDDSHSTADRSYSDTQDDAHSTADRAYTDAEVAANSTADRAYADTQLATHVSATGAHEATKIGYTPPGGVTSAWLDANNVQDGLTQVAARLYAPDAEVTAELIAAINDLLTGDPTTDPNVLSSSAMVAQYFVAGSVNAAAIDAVSVRTAILVADSITSGMINVTNLAAINSDLGAITAGSIDIGGADATSWHVDTVGNQWAGAGLFASAPFRVSNAGALVATSATITGSVTASSGAIGGWTIDADEIKSGDISINSALPEIRVGAYTQTETFPGGSSSVYTAITLDAEGVEFPGQSYEFNYGRIVIGQDVSPESAHFYADYKQVLMGSGAFNLQAAPGYGGLPAEPTIDIGSGALTWNAVDGLEATGDISASGFSLVSGGNTYAEFSTLVDLSAHPAAPDDAPGLVFNHFTEGGQTAMTWSDDEHALRFFSTAHDGIEDYSSVFEISNDRLNGSVYYAAGSYHKWGLGPFETYVGSENFFDWGFHTYTSDDQITWMGRKAQDLSEYAYVTLGGETQGFPYNRSFMNLRPREGTALIDANVGVTIDTDLLTIEGAAEVTGVLTAVGVDMSDGRIINLAAPINGTDAATKGYVDSGRGVCIATRTGQTINNTTFTLINSLAAEHDDGGWISGGAIVIPADGYYAVVGEVGWTTGLTTTARIITRVLRGAATIIGRTDLVPGYTNPTTQASGADLFSAGEVVNLQIYHNSGSAEQCNAILAVIRVA